MSDSEFSAHVTGLEPFLRKFQRAPAILTEELAKAGRKAGLSVENKAKRYAPVWRGDLRRSITSTASPFGTTVTPMVSVTRVGTAKSYAPVVEFGRRPGAAMPPVDAISRWLGSAKIGGDPKNAYAVARAIARRGIAGRPYLGKAFNELKSKIREEFGQVPKRVIARLQGGG